MLIIPPEGLTFPPVIKAFSEPFSYTLDYKFPESPTKVSLQLVISLSLAKRYPYHLECFLDQCALTRATYIQFCQVFDVSIVVVCVYCQSYILPFKHWLAISLAVGMQSHSNYIASYLAKILCTVMSIEFMVMRPAFCQCLISRWDAVPPYNLNFSHLDSKSLDEWYHISYTCD